MIGAATAHAERLKGGSSADMTEEEFEETKDAIRRLGLQDVSV